MVRRILRWFRLLSFSGAVAETTRAHTVNTLGTILLIVLLLCAVVLLPFFAKHWLEGLALTAALALLYAVFRFTIFRGRLAVSSAILLAAVWIFFTGESDVFRGAVSPLFFDLSATVVLAASLLSYRAANGVLLVVLLAGFCGALLPRLIAGAAPRSGLPSVSAWFLFALFLVLMNRIVVLSLRSFRQNEAKFRAVVERGHDGVAFCDAEATVLYRSPSSRRVNGYRDDERIGRHVFEIALPEDRPALERAWDRMIRDPELVPKVEYRMRRRDGSLAWVESSMQNFLEDPELRTIVISTREIGVRKRAEEALRESEGKLRAVFDQASDSIFILDPTASARGPVIIDANRAACRVTGFTHGELVGKPDRELDARDAGAPGRGECFLGEGGTSVFESVRRRKDGSTYPVEVSAALVTRAEKPPMIFAIERDLSERRSMEKKMLEQQQQLVQAEKMASLGMLVAGVAHEVNNPNHTIGLNAGLIERIWESLTPILEEYREREGDFLAGGIPYDELRSEMPLCVRGIKDASSHIDCIVSGLKSFAQAEENPEMLVIDLNMVVKAAVTLTTNMVKKAARGLSLDLAREMPPVRGSFSRLEQVVINLIQNACDALGTSRQGIEIRTVYDAEKGRVRLEVRDEGPGMSAEVLEKIALPFFTTKRDRGGMGLGVPISQSIVAAHGGELRYVSEAGRGTTATVALPAVVPPWMEDRG